MATKKSATKTSSKASLNLPIFNNKKQNKSQKKQLEKTIKTSSLKTLLVSFILIVVGFVIGAGGYFLICRNDTFEIIGGDEITLTLDEAYVENGVKAIEFGKDISQNVVIETNMNLDENKKSTEIGTFYVKYTIDSLKYGKIFKIEKIKLVTFVEASEGGE